MDYEKIKNYMNEFAAKHPELETTEAEFKAICEMYAAVRLAFETI